MMRSDWTPAPLLDRFMAFIGAAFVVSIATYPLESPRLQVSVLSLPLSSALMPTLFLWLPLLVLRSPRNAQAPGASPAVLAAMLLVLLLLVTLGNSLSYPTITLVNYKSIPYLALVALLPVFLERAESRLIMSALLLAMLIPTAFGFVRYPTGTGGFESEHQIGYWGIRYTESTRNSDVLYPLLGCISGLSLMRHSNIGFRFLLMMLSFGCAVAVVLSYSRGAWLALVIGVLMLHRQSKWSGARTRWIGLASVCVGVALAVALVQSKGPASIETLQDRFLSIINGSTEHGYSNVGRILLYTETLKGIVMHPLGVGIENFGALFQGTDFGEHYKVGNAENAYLNIAGEGGVVGAILFLSLLRRLWVSVKGVQTTDMSLSLRYESGRALLATMLVYFLFNAELNSLLAWSVLGIVGSLGYSRTNFVPAQESQPSRMYSILN